MMTRILSGATLLAMLAAGTAQAAEHSWSVAGSSLKIVTPCARTVRIEPAAAGPIEIVAAADHQQEIDRLSVTGGAVAVIDKTTRNCYGGAGSLELGPIAIGATAKPTLTLTVRVPAGLAIQIDEHGGGDYAIGAVGGDLDLTLAGSGNLTAATAARLKFVLSGSGNADIAVVNGRVDGRISGSGDAALDQVAAPDSDFHLSGSGHLTVRDGSVGQVGVAISGSGAVQLPNAAGLRLAVSGSGDSKVGRVDGPLEIHLSGSGNVAVGHIEAASAALHCAGASDVRLGGGAIGSLTVAAAGNSDIVIIADVTDADLSLLGSGEITLGRVSGRLAQKSSGSGRISIAGR